MSSPSSAYFRPTLRVAADNVPADTAAKLAAAWDALGLTVHGQVHGYGDTARHDVYVSLVHPEVGVLDDELVAGTLSVVAGFPTPPVTDDDLFALGEAIQEEPAPPTRRERWAARWSTFRGRFAKVQPWYLAGWIAFSYFLWLFVMSVTGTVVHLP